MSIIYGWIFVIMIIVIMIIGMWGAYNHGWYEGRHRERMSILCIIEQIQWSDVKNLSVSEVLDLVLDRLKKIWG